MGKGTALTSFRMITLSHQERRQSWWMGIGKDLIKILRSTGNGQIFQGQWLVPKLPGKNSEVLLTISQVMLAQGLAYPASLRPLSLLAN